MTVAISSDPLIECIVDEKGRTRWTRDGVLHRDDGPASISLGGVRKWYQHGVLHRDDGPAVLWEDGSERWYQHGVLHREDGPAETIYPYARYRIYGKEYLFGDFELLVSLLGELNASERATLRALSATWDGTAVDLVATSKILATS